MNRQQHGRSVRPRLDRSSRSSRSAPAVSTSHSVPDPPLAGEFQDWIPTAVIDNPMPPPDLTPEQQAYRCIQLERIAEDSERLFIRGKTEPITFLQMYPRPRPAPGGWVVTLKCRECKQHSQCWEGRSLRLLGHSIVFVCDGCVDLTRTAAT